MKSFAAASLAALCLASMAACGKSSNVSTQSAGSNGAGGGPVLVAAGTTVDGKLQQEIDTKTAHEGDRFTLVETDTLFHKTPQLHGAVIEGHLAGVSSAGMAKKPAMTIVFDDIRMPDGSTAPIDVTVLNMGVFDAKSHHMRTLGMMAGGALAGHMAAHVAGKKHGGLLGAAGGYVLSQQMKSDIDVKPGTIVDLKFNTDATASQPAAQST